MPDQSKLTEILSHMKSDYVPEHQAAADDFMSEGFPTEVLLSLIKKDPQPNLVSMYFYISGNRSDEEALAAWEYLRYRIEMNPEEFEADFYDPTSLDGVYRYLLFAARKYLITIPKFSVFLTHLKRIQDDAALVIKSALSTLDVNLDNTDEASAYPGDNERLIFNARYDVQSALPDFELFPTRRNFSADELEIVSHAAHLDKECLAILGKPTIPILLYRRWLVDFFLRNPPSQLKLHDLFPPVSVKEDLIPFVGYDGSTINYLYKEITDPARPKGRVTVDEIKSAFQRMRTMVLSFPLDDHNRKNTSSPYFQAVDEILRVDNKISLVGSIWGLLYERADVELCIEMLNRIEHVLLLQHSKDYEAYALAIISTSFYFYFEQNTYNAGYRLDFCNHVVYGLKKEFNVNFYENLLLPYLDEAAFFDIGSRRADRAYMALDALMAAKSISAYHFFRQLRSNKDAYKLTPPTSNYWTMRLKGFYNALSGNSNKRPAHDIGYDWERLCQEIVKTYCENALSNHEGVRLANNTIPDIVVGAIQRNIQGEITHVNRIIECKKSLYFAGFGSVLNNETTYQYCDFCDIMEYWILDEDTQSIVNTDTSNFPKLKCVFADDLLKSSWLSDDFKDAIRIMKMESLRRTENPLGKLVTSKDLYQAIDYLIKFPPPPPPLKPTKIALDKPKQPETVIRQYTLDGRFLKEFDSVGHAAAEVGVRVDIITNVTSGRRNSAGGFLWKKCLTNSPIENISPPNTALNLEGKVILQVDQYGEVVATFNTVGQAARLSGVSRRSISDALKGVQKTAGGFSWSLVNAETET